MKTVRWQAIMLILASCSICVGAEKGEDYSGQDLVRRVFSNKNLENATFEDSVCKQAKFDAAKLVGVNFQGADLTEASLANADATNADFRGAVLTRTSFSNATLNGANLEKQDLSTNSLTETKFRRANLRNLKGIGGVINVDFSEADIRGANLTGLRISDGARFRKAKYDKNTRWPQGFDVEASGAVLVEEPAKTDEPKPEPKGAPPKETPAKDLEKEFAKLDANDDGRLTGKEAKGLEELDANKDGRITLEEFVAGQKKK